MCTYLVFVFPAEFPENVRAEVFRMLAIRPVKYEGGKIQPAFSARESLWIGDQCQCGTMVGADSVPGDLAGYHERRIKRYKRLGWSDTKISRAMDDMAKPKPENPNWEVERQAWGQVIEQLRESNSIPWLGVFWHYYEGYIEEEALTLAVQATTLDNALEAVSILPQNTLLKVYHALPADA